jgi:hypothetical protein
MRSIRRKLLAALVLAVVGLTVFTTTALATETFYCGQSTPFSYCTVYSSFPRSTDGVAIRTYNEMDCATNCSGRIYFYSAGTGTFGVADTYGGTHAGYGSSAGNYVYSRCIADSGSFNAQCYTIW